MQSFIFLQRLKRNRLTPLACFESNVELHVAANEHEDWKQLAWLRSKAATSAYLNILFFLSLYADLKYVEIN